MSAGKYRCAEISWPKSSVRSGSVIDWVAFWTKRGRRREHTVVTTWIAAMPVSPESQTTRASVRCGLCACPQNNQRQLGPETVQSDDRDVPNEEYDERTKAQEMQTSGALTPVKEFYIPRETSGNGWGHCYSRRDTERSKQEYDCRVAQLL